MLIIPCVIVMTVKVDKGIEDAEKFSENEQTIVTNIKVDKSMKDAEEFPENEKGIKTYN